jgi:hydrogenase maturation protease
MNFTLPSSPQVAVIGLGNVFMGDDGFGPLAVELFRCQYESNPSIEVLDLGTPGLELAPYLCNRDLIVILDAVHADADPGTLSILFEADFISSRAKLRITGHDPGLWESLAHLRLAGCAPADLIVIGMTPDTCAFGDVFGEQVYQAACEAAATVARLLSERGVDCRRRESSHQPNLWWLPLAIPGRENCQQEPAPISFGELARSQTYLQ